MITVKLRTLGFLAVVPAGLLFSSCAVAPRRVGPAAPGAAELKITQDIIPPTNETGEHADYEGEGNRSSIGIEMCVNRGNDLGSTIDRTAQLTTRLMHQYDIPLDHVVPHMHWHMIRYKDSRDLGFKKCPRILLDGGRLGPKWSAFIAEVSSYAR